MSEIKEIGIRITKGIKGYLKAQVKLILVSFIILYLGLSYLDISHPVLLSIGLSLLDMIPILGIGIILVPWAIIQLIMGNTYLGIGLGLLYIITVIIRQVLEPIVIGKDIGLKPLYTLGVTIAASVVIGPLGVILGPIIAIILVAILDKRD